MFQDVNNTMAGWNMSRCNNHHSVLHAFVVSFLGLLKVKNHSLNSHFKVSHHIAANGDAYNDAAPHMSLRLFNVLHVLGKVVGETPSLRERNFDLLYCSCSIFFSFS